MEGTTEDAASLEVRRCQESAAALELAKDLHNNQRRKRRRTLMGVEDEQVA